MSIISVIIPTCNRPELLKKAILSVINQTCSVDEIIVVDDGLEMSAKETIDSFDDSRIVYIKNEGKHGGAAARNVGIKTAKGEFIAFLDDDDEWVAEKIKVQMGEFKKTSEDVAFSFTAVTNVRDDGEIDTEIPLGVDNYFERALRRFSGFLTVTLIIKKKAIEEVGYFDENFPSHQEPDLMIRISKKYKGLAINKPLTRVNMRQHEHINSSFENRIRGREMILEKYLDDFKARPKILAKHYFDLAIYCRDAGQMAKMRDNLLLALKTDFKALYLCHLFYGYVNSKKKFTKNYDKYKK